MTERGRSRSRRDSHDENRIAHGEPKNSEPLRRLTCKGKITDARAPANVSAREQDESVRKTPVQESITGRNPGCDRRVTILAKKMRRQFRQTLEGFLPDTRNAFPRCGVHVACITKGATCNRQPDADERSSAFSAYHDTYAPRPMTFGSITLWRCIGIDSANDRAGART